MKKKINNDTFNIGGNSETANIDIAKKVCSILKKSLLKNKKIDELISYVTDRPGHDIKYAVNCKKLENFLNFRIENKLNKNLKKTVNWYLKNKKWCEQSINRKYKLERLGNKK